MQKNVEGKQILTLAQIWQKPLPLQAKEPLTRLLCRTVTWLGTRRMLAFPESIEQIAPECDPFILVLNHNQKHESVLIPATLVFFRNGKLIHFMADWNYLLMPFVATLYRRGGSIIVHNKKAKPKFLNVFKPLFRQQGSAYERSLEKLKAGASLGIFIEGTVNRDPNRLMYGRTGAAQLALEAGVPIVPLGIRFPQQDPERQIDDTARMSLHFGRAVRPPAIQGKTASREEILSFHEQVMCALAQVCGKRWDPLASKRRKYVS